MLPTALYNIYIQITEASIVTHNRIVQVWFEPEPRDICPANIRASKYVTADGKTKVPGELPGTGERGRHHHHQQQG